MNEKIARALPQAKLEGFIVQEMVHRPSAYELIAGVSTDPTFGPVILFGQGGTAVEITPIRSIDKIQVGNGRRGPITAALQERFFGIVGGELPDTHNWLTPVGSTVAAK